MTGESNIYGSEFTEAVINNPGGATRVIRFETGRLAKQAAGSVTIYMGGRWFVEPPPNVPRELRGDTVGVSNVKEVDDFEALAHWLIGVDQRRPFRVTTLTAPTRLVIDVEV